LLVDVVVAESGYGGDGGGKTGKDYADYEGADAAELYGPEGSEGKITAKVSPHIRGFIDLDDWTYDAIVNSGNESRWVFVEVYAPWCGHCEKLVSELEVVAQAFEFRLFNILLVKINGEANPDLYKRFEVERYPTMFLTRPVTTEGEADLKIPFNDDDGRAADQIIDFIFDHTDLLKRGRVAEMDQYVKEFMAVVEQAKTANENGAWDKVTSSTLGQIISNAEKRSLSLKRDKEGRSVPVSGDISAHHEGELDEERSAFEFAIIYVKFMKGIRDKGKKFMLDEDKRLSDMLDSGTVATPKLDDILTRHNILGAFFKLAPQPVLTSRKAGDL